MGYMDKRAVIAANESMRLDQAKAEALAMARAGYRPPAPAKKIEVLGTEALAAFDTTHVGAVHTDEVGELLLTHAELLAVPAQVAPEPNLQLSFHEERAFRAATSWSTDS